MPWWTSGIVATSQRSTALMASVAPVHVAAPRKIWERGRGFRGNFRLIMGIFWENHINLFLKMLEGLEVGSHQGAFTNYWMHHPWDSQNAAYGAKGVFPSTRLPLLWMMGLDPYNVLFLEKHDPFHYPHRPGAWCCFDRNLQGVGHVEVWSACFDGTPGGDGWDFFKWKMFGGVGGWLGGRLGLVGRFHVSIMGFLGGAWEETNWKAELGGSF